MSVYVPPAFAARDSAAIARLVHDYPFATLITTVDSEPVVSHLPFIHVAEGEPHGMLLGHMARANPHWRRLAGTPSLALFHGPHAYVSPSWYAAPATAVPTWNYAVVHMQGIAELIDDDAQTRAILDAMVGRFESGRAEPWRLVHDRPGLDALVGAIVAFRFRISRIDAKFKMSQNRSAEDRLRVIDALRSEGYAEASATAEWMAKDAQDG
jgi:transcriptional regulator